MAEANAVAKNKKPFFARMIKYFKDTKSELKKVTWPSKEQLKQNTGVIIAFIIMVAIFLLIFDTAFGALVGFIPKLS